MTTRRAAGFTLIELVVSLSMMAVLTTGLASAILLMTRALPSGDSPVGRSARATDLLERMTRDLRPAIEVTEAGPTAVAVIVPDRGLGAAGPETIRYSWGGSAGDPVEIEINGGSPEAIAKDVEHFELGFQRAALESPITPRVFMIAGSSLFSGADERRAWLESWGFAVQAAESGMSESEIRDAIAESDVMYVASDAGSLWGDVVNAIGPNEAPHAAVGVVTELASSYDDLGIASSVFTAGAGDDIDVGDDTHAITAEEGDGDLNFARFPILLNQPSGSVAPGLHELARSSTGSILGVLEPDAALSSGERAPGRRVVLPWGDPLFFELGSLREEGRTLLRAALSWAAAPTVYSTIDAEIQIGPDRTSAARGSIPLSNAAEVMSR